jgi:hypothetical protein
MGTFTNLLFIGVAIAAIVTMVVIAYLGYKLIKNAIDCSKTIIDPCNCIFPEGSDGRGGLCTGC